MATWRCIERCVAVLGSERSPRRGRLSFPRRLANLSLVGADGWCIHYDRLTRRCGIYEDRPR